MPIDFVKIALLFHYQYGIFIENNDQKNKIRNIIIIFQYDHKIKSVH